MVETIYAYVKERLVDCLAHSERASELMQSKEAVRTLAECRLGRQCGRSPPTENVGTGDQQMGRSYAAEPAGHTFKYR